MKTEWISVNDRLPEFEKEVLLYWEWFSEETKYQTFKVGYLVEVRSRKSLDGVVNYAQWHVEDDYSNTNPTHWMPLPEPPKP